MKMRLNRIFAVIAAITVFGTAAYAEGDIYKAYFTGGHSEAGFTAARQLLEDEGYEVEALEAAEIPDDADVVIIAEPKKDFTVEELENIAGYISGGGVLEVYIDNECSDYKNLGDYLALNGIKIGEGGIVENSDYVANDLLRADIVSNGITDRVSAEYVMYAPYARPLEIKEISGRNIDINAYLESSAVSAVTTDFKTAGELGSSPIALRSINYENNGTIYVCGTTMLLEKSLEELSAAAPENAEYFVAVTNGLVDLEGVFNNPAESVSDEEKKMGIPWEIIITAAAAVGAAVVVLRRRKRNG